jgi:hypothetical protein
VEAAGHIAPRYTAVYFQREPMIEIRLPRTTDAAGCAELAAIVIGPDRAGPFIKSHLERHHLMVAEAAKEIVGFLAYRTDWFCGSGFWGGQRPSLADYVVVMGPDGAPAAGGC